MRVSNSVGFAFIALLDMALDPERRVTVSELAERQALSISYFEQIFTRLRRAGVVRGTRGPGGGYLLRIPASEITLAKVIDILMDEDGREIVNSPPSSLLWDKLSDQMRNYFHIITLADCIEAQPVES